MAVPIPLSVFDDVGAVSVVQACRVESWRGGQLLASEIPVISGTLLGDRSLQVPEQVSLTVPVEADGVRWDPLAEDDPLACYGQQLRISVGLMVRRKMYWVPRAPMVVTGTQRDGDTVTVTAASLLHLVAEARLVTPLQPKAGDTLKKLARRLVEPGLPVRFDDDLVDRAVPTSTLQWDDDRIGALYELAAAWPAELSVHRDGYLLFTPPAQPSDVWSADVREDMVRVTAAQARDGGVNCVVARGTAADGTQVQGVAYDTASTSPTRYMGPFSPYPVPLFFDSPLLTTTAQCQAAARTVLARRRRAVARSVTQDMKPWPGHELGDLVLARDDRVGDLVVTIETMTMPLTPDGGPMSLGLAVPSA